jgi:hypothetical protein
MALTDDQKAMLRLLAQREEGYEDIAALKGVSVEAVRAEVRAAVAALDDDAGAAGPVAAEGASGLTRPDTPSSTPPAEEKSAPAPRPQAKVRAPRSAPRWKEKLPRDRRRVVELVGGALVALLLILFVTGAIDIGGGDEDSSSGGQVAGGERLSAAEEENLTQAQLTAADGGDADGRAIFGRIGEKEVALQVTARNLEPSADGESYSVWLYRSPKLALQVGAAKVRENGTLAARFPLPAELLAYVASGAFPQVYVSRTDDAALKRQLQQAQRKDELPSYSGETVLRGEISGPITEQAANEQGKGKGNGGG